MVVGAGFASGREITDYFLLYGERWKTGIAVSGALFFVYTFAASYIIGKNSIKSYGVYLDTIMGKRLAMFTEYVSGTFFAAMFYAMLSATGAVAEEMLSMPYIYGVIIMAAASAVIITGGMRAMEYISVIIVPILIAGICLIGAKSEPKIYIGGNGGSVVLSAVIYVSYNTITAAAIMVKEEKTGKANGIVTGILCAAAMTVMGYIIGNTILSFDNAYKSELPFAAAANIKYGNMLLYGAIFIAAVLTTAVCNGSAAADFIVEKTGINKNVVVILLCAVSPIFSAVAFSDFVSKIYMLFGFIGVFQLLFTILYLFKRR